MSSYEYRGDDDEDDDRPLGGSLLTHTEVREQAKDREAFRASNEFEEQGSDRSGESRHNKRHNRVSETPEKSSRRRIDEEGCTDDVPNWKRSRDEPLFTDSGKTGMDRKLEKAVSEVTLDMLEAVRLGQDRLLHILEHPRAEDFIFGAYVRYPDLEKVEADGVTPREAPLLPAQITKITSLKTPEQVITHSGSTYMCSHQMTIMQYTQRFDNSLKKRKARLNISYVANEPFEMRELQQWRELLKLFCGRAGAEKLLGSLQMLLETAERLKSFTFTDEDVNDILRRRAEQQEGLARLTFGQTLNWRDLYLKKAELEFQIQELQSNINDSGDMVEDSMNDTVQKLEQTQAELEQVKHNLDVLRKEETDRKDVPRLLDQESIDPPNVTGAVAARQLVRTRSSVADVLMLTPRFLQTKSSLGGSNRVTDWRSLESTQQYTKVIWTTAAIHADTLYKPAHAKSEKEWKTLKEKLAVQLRADDIPDRLEQVARKVATSGIDVEDRVHKQTCEKLRNLFRLPFPAPPRSKDAKIITIKALSTTKTEE